MTTDTARGRIESSQASTSSSGRGSSEYTRCCARGRERTSPASRNTRRCRETAGREIVNAAASSPAVSSRSASRRRTLRRVGSAIASYVVLAICALCNRSVT